MRAWTRACDMVSRDSRRGLARTWTVLTRAGQANPGAMGRAGDPQAPAAEIARGRHGRWRALGAAIGLGSVASAVLAPGRPVAQPQRAPPRPPAAAPLSARCTPATS